MRLKLLAVIRIEVFLKQAENYYEGKEML